MRILVGILLLLLTGCTHLQVNQALLVTDWGQTRYIASSPQFYETNPILGKYPSEDKVDLYFLSWLAVNPVLSKKLGKKYDWVVTAVEIGCIANNYSKGVRLDFRW